MKFTILSIALFAFNFIVKAQINFTDFESWGDEHEYLKSSFESDGFDPQWVNGFNQSRCFIDDAYSKSGSKSLRIKYPANQSGTSNSGAQSPLQFSGKDKVYISYWLRFSDEFDWGGTNEGGKLPGLAGGDNCSGGSTCDGTNGFSARLMWRTGGKAVLYLYHMDKPGAFGEDLDLLKSDGENFVFEKGIWYHIAERVKVNTGSNKDGEVTVWVNNKKVLEKTELGFVTNGDKVDNFYFSTFHGGSGSSWAPSVDSYIWFDDLIISENENEVLFNTITSNNNYTPKSSELVFPNPTSGLVNFNKTLSYEVYDLVGNSLLKGASNQIDITSFNSGFYFIKTEESIFKIMKQ